MVSVNIFPLFCIVTQKLQIFVLKKYKNFESNNSVFTGKPYLPNNQNMLAFLFELSEIPPHQNIQLLPNWVAEKLKNTWISRVDEKRNNQRKGLV